MVGEYNIAHSSMGENLPNMYNTLSPTTRTTKTNERYQGRSQTWQHTPVIPALERLR